MRTEMEINSLPKYDMSDRPTNCCPRFNPNGWDEQELHFRDKRFVKAKTRSIFHIPINMSSVYAKVISAIEKGKAIDDNDFIVLSYDPSLWTGEHYFAVTKDVPGQNMVHMSGDYLTKYLRGLIKMYPDGKKK